MEEGSQERVSPICIAAVCQRESLGVLQMQELESMSLDDIHHDNFENILLVDDPVVGTPLYEQVIDNTDEERDAQYNY